MILLIGQVGTDFMEREAFQEIDYRRMFGPDVEVGGADRSRPIAFPSSSRAPIKSRPVVAWGRWCWRFQKMC